jgi:hypothetical protein
MNLGVNFNYLKKLFFKKVKHLLFNVFILHIYFKIIIIDISILYRK